MNMQKNYMPAGGLGRGSNSAPPPGSAIDVLSKRSDGMHAPQPLYEVDRVGGADHKPLFRAVVTYFPEGYVREGLGNSKMEAKRVAAAALLELLELRRRKPGFFAGETYEDRSGGEGKIGGLRGGAVLGRGGNGVQGARSGGLRGIVPQNVLQHSGMPLQGGMSMQGGMHLQGGMPMQGEMKPPGGGMPRQGAMPTQGGIPQGGMPPQGGVPQGGMPPHGTVPRGTMPPHGAMAQGQAQVGMQPPSITSGVGMPPGSNMPPNSGVPPPSCHPSQPTNSRVAVDPNSVSISALPPPLQDSIRQYQSLPQQQQNPNHQNPNISAILSSIQKNPNFMQNLQSSVGPSPLALSHDVKQPTSHRVDPRDPNNERQVAKVVLPLSRPASQSAAAPVKVESVPVGAQSTAFKTSGRDDTASNLVNGNNQVAGENGVKAPKVIYLGDSGTSADAPSPSKSGNPGMLSKKKRLLLSADSIESPATPAPAIAKSAKSVDAPAGDGGGFGEMPDIAIPRKRGRFDPAPEAVQSQAHQPAFAQPQHQQPRPTQALSNQQPVAQQANRPNAPLTALLFVYIDDLEAMRATVSLAGSAAASRLDLQVRAFGPSRDELNAADHAVPVWMQVTRVEPAVLDVNVAFAAGRDACQFEAGGGRIIVVSSSGMLASLALPNVLDVVLPADLDRHLSCLF